MDNSICQAHAPFIVKRPSTDPGDDFSYCLIEERIHICGETIVILASPDCQCYPNGVTIGCVNKLCLECYPGLGRRKTTMIPGTRCGSHPHVELRFTVHGIRRDDGRQKRAVSYGLAGLDDEIGINVVVIQDLEFLVIGNRAWARKRPVEECAGLREQFQRTKSVDVPGSQLL